ncbi:MAG: peptide chain release factor N(5)-glutamine methyltransferase [Chitinophagaceae bacterium]|nr:MAG: peptide chain release factor N(5)-glutamine methyltransferase [Chitinophagaceae bacterium]
MQLRAFYNQFLQELAPIYGYDESAAIATMVFEAIGGSDRTTIITQPDLTIEKELISPLEAALLKLKKHEPVQYVIGYAWFAGLKFRVTDAVLIPRPETEELLNEVAEFHRHRDCNKFLDIGTGSGCIPVSIKKLFPELDVSAMDVSPSALEIAQLNAREHDVVINWMEQDFLDESTWPDLPMYDLITSNPPYIPQNEEKVLDANVIKYEPHLALFVPENDPLVFYKKIARFGLAHLSPTGSLFMETHELYGNDVVGHFIENGYEASLKEDMFGKVRMVMASRCH